MVILRPIDNGFVVETHNSNRYFEGLDGALDYIKWLITTACSAPRLSDWAQPGLGQVPLAGPDS